MLRWAKNCVLPLSGISSLGRRNYAATELSLGSKEIASKPKFVPCGGATFVQNVGNPSCDMHDTSTLLYGFRYSHIIEKALQIEGSKALEAGADPWQLEYGIDAARREVLAYLKLTARMVNTPEEISQVGIAVANGDIELGSWIAEGLKKVGNSGFCMVCPNGKVNNEVEFVKALSVNEWIIYSNYFLTNKRKEICLLKNPYILVIVDKILNKNLVRAVEQIIRPTTCSRPRPLLIIAEDAEKGVEGSIMSEEFSPRRKTCVVKPCKGLFKRETWKAIMEDFAIFTGGQVVTGEFDVNFMPQALGSCKMVRISFSTMSLYDAAGNEKVIEKRREQLRSELNLNPSMEYLESRLQNLSPAVRFKVGRATNYNKVYNVRVAINTAMRCGILPGCGVAFLNASKALDKMKIENADGSLGVQLLQKALKMPVYCIASAAGFDGALVVEKLMEQDNPDLGYDPATGEYVEMIKSGNIDIVDTLVDELRKSVGDFRNSVLGRECNGWWFKRWYSLPPYY